MKNEVIIKFKVVDKKAKKSKRGKSVLININLEIPIELLEATADLIGKEIEKLNK